MKAIIKGSLRIRIQVIRILAGNKSIFLAEVLMQIDFPSKKIRGIIGLLEAESKEQSFLGKRIVQVPHL